METLANMTTKKRLCRLMKRGGKVASSVSLALVLGASSAFVPMLAFADTGQVTIQATSNTAATYKVYQVFSADMDDNGDDATSSAYPRIATHFAWANSDIQMATLAFLDENGYGDWLSSHGYTASDARELPQVAAQFIAEQIGASLDDSDATVPLTKKGQTFALEFAKRHPDRVGRVIAISPGGITGSMPLSVRMIRSGVFGGIASRVYRVRSVEKMLNECVFDHTVVGPHDINEYFRPASDPDGRAAIRYTIVGFDEDELAASLREVEAPVLIIWGEDDKWHPMEASSLYRSTIPNATVTIVRNAGHLVHEEKPDRICELVRSFVPAGYGFDD